ncbi:MAG: Rrf2 family transcriptional regulator [Candidatus Omnitrophica bacterium]|nr:Rrf2 family transcriptional regulator [Candidatus Omnitrophota bacterium]
MFRLYSKGCEYVMRALAQVGERKNGGCFSVRDICEKAELPEWYTRKIFQSLVRRGLLIGARGPGGGYQFGKPPKKISILAMIQAIDGEDVLEQCVMGPGKCNQRERCALHPIWLKIKASLLKELRASTIEDLLSKKLSPLRLLHAGEEKYRKNLKREDY